MAAPAAVPATSVWEFRTAGNANNAGIFDYATGAALLSPNDLACAAGSKTVTSATGGFTSAMAGHILRVTGGTGGWVPGPYIIDSYGDGNTITLTDSPCPKAAGTAGTGTVSAGKDYSYADNPVATPTDLASVAGTSVITAASNPFTADMVDNYINIPATGHFQAGRRRIVTYTNAGQVTLCSDPTDGSDAVGGTGYIGGAIYQVNGTNLDALMDLVQPGNNVYIKDGDYTITTADIGAGTVGTNTLPVNVMGYNATRGDAPTGDDSPLIDLGAYVWNGANSWGWHHLRMTGTSNPACLVCGATSLVVNCTVVNTSTSARGGLRTGAYARVAGCELRALAGPGYLFSSSNCAVYYSRFRDSAVGVTIGNHFGTMRGCLFEQCVTGVSLGSAWIMQQFEGNTFVGCGQAIATTAAADCCVFQNNLFAYCTTGLTWSTNYLNHLVDYNNFYGNGTDVNNVTKGPHDTATDPAFAALHSWTDLVVSAGSNVVITSVTGGFTTYYEAGDYIWIDAATDWTSGCYRIVSVDSTNQLTLATSPAAVNKTGGIARTLRTGVGVSDCTPGAASDVNDGYLGLALGVG